MPLAGRGGRCISLTGYFWTDGRQSCRLDLILYLLTQLLEPGEPGSMGAFARLVTHGLMREADPFLLL
jgi:hypothetical protein